MRQGDPGNVMYFIADGTLEVRLYLNNRGSKNMLPLDSDMKASDMPSPANTIKVPGNILDHEKKLGKSGKAGEHYTSQQLG